MEFLVKTQMIFRKYIYVFLVLLTTFFICTINPDLLEMRKECRIQLNALYDDTVKHGQEIWLTQVKINDENVPISSLKILKNQNWRYQTDCDDYVFYPNMETKDNILVFSLEAGNDVKLVFEKSSWCGTVQIMTEKENVNIDLFSESVELNTYQINPDNYKYIISGILIPAMEVLILSAFFVMAVSIILKKLRVFEKLMFICEVLSFNILRKYDL